MPSFSGSVARLRDRVAYAVVHDHALTINMAGETYLVTPSSQLRSYPLLVTYTSIQGDLQIGLSVAAIFGEFSRDILENASTFDTGISHWVEWLLMPWLDFLEQRLGINLTYVSVQTDAIVSQDSVTLGIANTGGAHGNLVLHGSLLEYFDFPEYPVGKTLPPLLKEVAISVALVCPVEKFYLTKIREIIPGAFLCAQLDQPEIHLRMRNGKFILKGRWVTDGVILMDAYEDDVEQENYFDGSEDKDTLVSLDQVTLHVDILLETLEMPVAGLAQLNKGGFLKLAQPQEARTVSIRCNGKTIAKGEIVAIDKELAVLVTEVIGRQA